MPEAAALSQCLGLGLGKSVRGDRLGVPVSERDRAEHFLSRSHFTTAL